MRGTLVGISRMTGLGKESKRPYDIVRALLLSAIVEFSKEGFTRSGAGFEVVEVEVAPEAYASLCGLKFPYTGDIAMDQVVKGGKLATVICGVRPVGAAAGAAA